jgi:predicted ATPase
VKINGALHHIGRAEMRAEPDRALLADFTSHTSGEIPVLVVPYILESCARSSARLGRHEDAQRLLEDAFAASHRGPRWFEAELHRTSGELGLLRSPNTTELAERAFRDAIELARQQSARSLELRATISLARLLRDTGRRDKARSTLAEIYNWVTEGFDTADLKDAKALLEELAN